MSRFVIPGLLVVTAGCTAIACWFVASRGAVPAAYAAPQRTTVEWRTTTTGAASCSASACHGAVRPDDVFPGIKGDEYRSWIERDPHARSYSVLLDKPARQIAARLGLGDAHTAKACLECHAPGAIASSPDGVACQTCHGRAEKWLTQHYEPAWRNKTAAEKSQQGMTDTKNLAVRARLCATCHVGDAERDVNHDLIAAGHPRLNFEFSSYLAVLPKHWAEEAQDPQNTNYDPAFTARAWAVGQVVSAAAALELLAARSAPGRPWPEFAEFDCAACHHHLQAESWRQTEVYEQQRVTALKPGSPRWGTWYFAMSRVWDSQRPKLPQRESIPFDELAGWNALSPELLRRVDDTQRRLSEWAEELNVADFDVAALRQYLIDVAGDQDQPAILNWDGVVQWYLALVAVEQTAFDAQQRAGQPLSPSEQELAHELRALHDDLHQPQNFRPSKSRDAIRRLQTRSAE